MGKFFLLYSIVITIMAEQKMISHFKLDHGFEWCHVIFVPCMRRIINCPNASSCSQNRLNDVFRLPPEWLEFKFRLTKYGLNKKKKQTNPNAFGKTSIFMKLAQRAHQLCIHSFCKVTKITLKWKLNEKLHFNGCTFICVVTLQQSTG